MSSLTGTPVVAIIGSIEHARASGNDLVNRSTTTSRRNKGEVVFLLDGPIAGDLHKLLNILSQEYPGYRLWGVNGELQVFLFSRRSWEEVRSTY
ncbi:hypothetical protein BS47DRAFT_125546 [Hydnum rufescens UP504]|uniref:Uncharacterized protein n=1 Tax=Hydnum rufescens UP504 TaxID=1448309 RepID=A0A9P6B7C8_9AGAM|nr:hypothetical protein BS47DRAFT_125546 [Hydnum rufescens UP504]